MQKTIFVVDDNHANLSMAKNVLKDQYTVMTMPSAAKMFELLSKIIPDLILLDIEMPEMNGFEALRRLKTKSAYTHIPIIFLTGMTDTSIEVRGFRLGVIDFITKPFSAPVLLNRIKTHLQIDDIIHERMKQIKLLKNAIVFGFADVVEKRDHETGGHIERTSDYIAILVNAMLNRGVYIEELTGMDLDTFISSARLHDVGKIAIPDHILNKPGKLTDEEFEIMKTHVKKGVEIINMMASRVEDDDFLKNAASFVGYHHERWDGTGYPYGLSGTEIPLQGRIMAIADVYDALVSVRPYKNPFSDEKAVQIIMEGSGKHFDPIIADVFYEIRDEYRAVKLSYSGDSDVINMEVNEKDE
ncbi:MAG: response regulator [Lachnospiraceae bacterium]|nr:response regulator [Lachnospiraceae bacterium]